MFWTKIKTLMCDLERLQCVVKRHDYRLQYAEEAYKAIETENKTIKHNYILKRKKRTEEDDDEDDDEAAGRPHWSLLR